MRLNKTTELPPEWEDGRIQGAAGLLSVSMDVEPIRESVERAQEWLIEVGRQYDLDPDQLFRALCEHEPFLAFQEEDEMLKSVCFGINLKGIKRLLRLRMSDSDE